MEVLLLATEARRAILAGETVAAARIATSMETIRWDNPPGLSRIFFLCGRGHDSGGEPAGLISDLI